MPTRVQRAFSAGEWSPARAARADRGDYYNALRTCRNFLVLRGGGIANRPGLRKLINLGMGAGRVRFVRFVVAPDQVYLIALGAGGARIIRDGVQVAGVGLPYTSAEIDSVHVSQSIGVMVLTHVQHAPRELRRISESEWTVTIITTGPALAPPTGVAAVPGAPGALTRGYRVTALTASPLLEESTASLAALVTDAEAPTEEAPHVVSWSPVDGATEYNVYCDPTANGTYGFIGTTPLTSFRDVGQPPDFGLTPPLLRLLFAAEGQYPGTVGHVQQRRVFAATRDDPQAIWASQIGIAHNFCVSSPLQDSDSLAFRIFGSEGQRIEHILSLGGFVLLTSGGVWVVSGDADGALTPFSVRPDQVGYNGSDEAPPVVIGRTIVFLQTQRRIIRDLRLDSSDGFDGRDLTQSANHLFDARRIRGLAYAETPHSMLWAARDDGTLLGLTYIIRPQEGEDAYGWARHDTLGGEIEAVAAVPEGGEDAVYVCVRRRQGSAAHIRTIERLETRHWPAIEHAFYVDSGITMNGWNTDPDVRMLLLTVADGGWTADDTIEMSMNTGTFSSADVGDSMVLEDRAPDGTVLDRVTILIETFIDDGGLRGRPTRTVPAVFRAGYRSSWGLARRTVVGLEHLEGELVSILADGNVVSNGDPGVEGAEAYRVVSGRVTLPRAAVVIQAGLPITADAETLDLDAPGEDLRDRTKQMKAVALLVESTRSVWAGASADRLFEVAPTPLPDYDTPPPLQTGRLEVVIGAEWNAHGRVFVRQRDPLPLTILSIMSHGGIGG